MITCQDGAMGRSIGYRNSTLAAGSARCILHRFSEIVQQKCNKRVEHPVPKDAQLACADHDRRLRRLASLSFETLRRSWPASSRHGGNIRKPLLNKRLTTCLLHCFRPRWLGASSHFGPTDPFQPRTTNEQQHKRHARPSIKHRNCRAKRPHITRDAFKRALESQEQ